MKEENQKSLLIIDDDNDVLFTAKLVLRGIFSRIDTLDDPKLIPQYLKAKKYDVIILDMNFNRGDTSGREGLEWLDKIFIFDSNAKVLTTTAYGEINLAVQAMKKGASDFLIKPWNKSQLVTSVQNIIQAASSQKPGKKQGHNSTNNEHPHSEAPSIISRSESMEKIADIIKTVAPTNASVLITGETGTGKELVANILHHFSMRSQNPFVHVDLGTIPDTLFESELFGHTRGAFTDAREEKAGRFETASGGTLFLDEIGNLTLPLQAKILTSIQKREVVRLGSNIAREVNVRIISATNMHVYDMAENFMFRKDLLYRINTVEISLPPLRERKEDIEPLAAYFLQNFGRQYEKEGLGISENAQRRMMEYNWPGNIRELEQEIERAVIFCRNQKIDPADFSFTNRQAAKQTVPEIAIKVEDYERKAIKEALNKHGGNLSRAAAELGIARSTLYRKIAYFGSENLSENMF